MIRFFAMTSCLLSLTLAVLAAQDPAKGPGKEPEPILKKKTKKDDEPELKKIDPAKDPKDKKEDPKDKKDVKEPELKKIEPGDVPAIGNREKREDIIARIDKNLKAAADDLKKFADDPTRKKQRDIVKDLDDLINQQDEDNKNNSGGGAGGGHGGNQGNAGNQGGAGQGGGQANRGGRGRRGGGAGGKGNAGNQGGNGGVGQQNKEPNGGQEKKNPKGGNDAGQANKDQKGGKEVGGGNPPPPDNTKPKNAGDMKTNFWGDLPKHKRLEMDAHLQDRFLDRYESVIRQYFTTIGEKKLGSDKK